MQQVQVGDEAAFSQLYDLTLARIYAMVNRMLNNASLCEDIVAEVYLQVWQRAQNYQSSRGNVLAWLFVIARSRSLDALRKLKRHSLGQERYTQDRLTTDQEVVDIAEMVEDGALKQGLQSLSFVQRQIVSLSYFQGLSHQEISDHLNIPLGTVKSHVRRGVQVLQQQMRTSDGLLNHE